MKSRRRRQYRKRKMLSRPPVVEQPLTMPSIAELIDKMRAVGWTDKQMCDALWPVVFPSTKNPSDIPCSLT